MQCDSRCHSLWNGNSFNNKDKMDFDCKIAFFCFLFQVSSFRRKPSVFWSVWSGCMPACGPHSPSWGGAAMGPSHSDLPAQWTGWAMGIHWITPRSSWLCRCSAPSCPTWSSSSLISASPGSCTGLTNQSRAPIFNTPTLKGESLL